jgi:aminocarboxymuconate-semialdehyde decarboxylase
MRKIDVFTHISPPGYSEAVERIAGGLKDIGKRTRGVPMLHDLDVRFRVMELFPQYQQVLSLHSGSGDRTVAHRQRQHGRAGREVS